MELPTEVELEGPDRRGWGAALLGVASALLLAASIRWAHHWGPGAEAIVGAWAFATLGAIGVSIWSIKTERRRARRVAKAGLTLGLLSVLALALAGMASAAGIDVSAACGGG